MGCQLPADVVDIRNRVWLADLRRANVFEEKKEGEMMRAIPIIYGGGDQKRRVGSQWKRADNRKEVD